MNTESSVYLGTDVEWLKPTVGICLFLLFAYGLSFVPTIPWRIYHD